jgi:hypothetical protein
MDAQLSPEGSSTREVGRSSSLAFLALFSLVIGPINLFVFGRRKNRLRLVWTTPAIAIAATILLTSLILATDGIGGAGDRFVVTLISPREGRKVVLQDQASRTGVVWQRRLEGRPGLYMEQYAGTPSLHERRYVRLHDDYDGDWFGNRGTQAQSLEWIEATHERIEIHRTSSGAPVVLSSIAQPLGTFFYIAPDDVVWTAEEVVPGKNVGLQRSDRAALEAWLESQVGMQSGLAKVRAAGAKTNGDWFFATGKRGGEVARETYARIRWRDIEPLFLGPVVRVGP